ncbi:MAG: hypothetical protein QOJ72_1122 [Nocardioidaceae bacterium]|jgi:hypothetical protein|nr:hypothetical protein [Nocardioidaceae bacterium]
MTTQLELMPAQNPTEPTSTTGSLGEGVNAMAIFESRQVRDKRAWDEVSEIDRAVLLETVRRRREAQRQRQAMISALYGLRKN